MQLTSSLFQFQVKIWFQNRRMKWRNSKERELIAHGGCREQTLPTKHNPNPDLSDPASPSILQNSKSVSTEQSNSNTNTNSQPSSQHQISTSPTKPPPLSYLSMPPNSLLHPSQHPSLAASLPWMTGAASISSEFSLALKRGGGSSGQSVSSPSEIGIAITSAVGGIGPDSIDGDDDEDLEEDIEVEDVDESEDDDKDEEDGDTSEKQNICSKQIAAIDGGKRHSDEDIQVT